MPPLYFWKSGDSSIAMNSGAVAFLNANGNALETIANHWWARYLEKVNLLAPLIIEKVERDGARRGSLVRYLKILMATDEPNCFYCERPLAQRRAIHVDHVIPWSFLLADPMWDLVLACSSCNLSKSDVLPARDFLEKLVARGERRAKFMLPSGYGSPLIPAVEVERYFEAALSVEWPRGWRP